MPSYLNLFKELAKESKNLFRLTGDCLIIEELPKEELKTESGILLASVYNARNADGIEENRPVFVKVLLCGEGFYNEEMESIPLDSKPGDICLVGKHSVKWLTSFGPIISKTDARIGLVKESEIQLRFFGDEGYKKTAEILKNVQKTSS